MRYTQKLKSGKPGAKQIKMQIHKVAILIDIQRILKSTKKAKKNGYLKRWPFSFCQKGVKGQNQKIHIRKDKTKENLP